MIMIYIQIIGCGLFFLSTIVLGAVLKKYPSEKVREKTTHLLHFIGVFTLLLPVMVGIFYPGLTSYDALLGIASLPFKPLAAAFALVMIPMGIFFMATSMLALALKGQGQPGFVLTKKMVHEYVYKLSRNPMSFGFYMGALGLGLLAGSTYFTLWVLIAVIPFHVFFLKYFEELELQLRFGQPYLEYKKKVPFLIPKYRSRAGMRSITTNNY